MVETIFGFIYKCAPFFNVYLIPLVAVVLVDVAVTIVWRLVLRD